jgi:hypothetical protein
MEIRRMNRSLERDNNRGEEDSNKKRGIGIQKHNNTYTYT